MSIFALVYGGMSHTCSALRGQSWASDTLSLELGVSHHVSAGSLPRVTSALIHWTISLALGLLK